MIDILIKHYYPGYKAGGALRSVMNFTRYFSSSGIEGIKVFTLNHDYKSKEKYPNIKSNSFNVVLNHDVFYMTPLFKSFRICTELNSSDNKLIYLNSFFDFNFSIFVIILKKFGFFPNKKILLAPRGELFDGALKIKPIRKYTYLYISKVLGLYKDIIFHSSTKLEKQTIKKNFPHCNVHVALDMVYQDYSKGFEKKQKELENDDLRLIFISRIAPKKNLLFLVEVFKNLPTNYNLDLYGPIDDQKYFNQCKERFLEADLKFNYLGDLEYERINDKLKNYDFFIFPTKSENFGHVIFESLSAGTPVLTSYETPWLDLEKYNAGYNLNIDNPESFQKCLEQLMRLDDAQKLEFRLGTQKYLNNVDFLKDIISKNKQIFEFAQ